MSMLHIQLLGDIYITCGNTPLSLTTRLQSLLAYLLLHRTRPLSRKQIAYLFWPESGDSQALKNLRSLLTQLRRALPNSDQFLQIDNQTMVWRADAPYTLDVAEFEETLSQVPQPIFAPGSGPHGALSAQERETSIHLLTTALDLYTGELLPGFHDDWVLAERQRLHNLFFDATQQLCLLLEEAQAYDAARQVMERLLEYDPLREATYHTLMRYHLLNGERAQALRVYHSCVEILLRELDVEPGAGIQELHQQIIEDESSRIASPPNPTIPPPPPERGRDREHRPQALVNRQVEWAQFRAAWQHVEQGHSHVLLISGEMGIGKTRLLEELTRWAHRQDLATATARCYAVEGALSYAPVVEWLRGLQVVEKLAALDDVWLTELSRLLPEIQILRPDLPAAGSLAEGWQRQRLFETFTQALFSSTRIRTRTSAQDVDHQDFDHQNVGHQNVGHQNVGHRTHHSTSRSADHHPLLLCLDDVQWCDPETIAWLHYMLRHNAHVPLLIACTVRTGEVSAGHPLQELCTMLHQQARMTELHLARLSKDETAQLAQQRVEYPLAAEKLDRLHRITDGNPLFVVELIHAHASDRDDTLPLESAAQQAPTKLQMAIERHLAQLSPAGRTLLDWAATIGYEVPFELMAALRNHMRHARAEFPSAEAILGGLEELQQRNIIREQKAGLYQFSHEALREFAYAQLGPTRQQLQHRRIARALEALHAGDPDSVAGQLAFHYARGDRPAAAARFHQRAATVAQQSHAQLRAIHHLQRAIALNATLPPTPERTQTDVDLHVELGTLLIATRRIGDPDIAAVLNQAHQISQRLPEPQQRFAALCTLCELERNRLNLDAAVRLGSELLGMAQTLEEPEYLISAHWFCGSIAIYRAELAKSAEHLQQIASLYRAEHHHALVLRHGYDPHVAALSYTGLARHLQGYADQAMRFSTEAVSQAEALAHPLSRVFALAHAAILHILRQEPQPVAEIHAQIATLAERHGFAHGVAVAQQLQAWLLGQRGNMDEQLALYRRLLFRDNELIIENGITHYLSLFAGALIHHGDLSAARQLLEQAQELAATTGEAMITPELWRLEGQVHWQQSSAQPAAATEAEACFQEAVGRARAQNAKFWELRATVSLCRFWQARGRQTEAYRTLAAIYAWFAEGFDTVDLQEARALLAELSEK